MNAFVSRERRLLTSSWTLHLKSYLAYIFSIVDHTFVRGGRDPEGVKCHMKVLSFVRNVRTFEMTPYLAQLAFHHQSSWCLSLAFSAAFFFFSEAKLALRSSHSFRFPFASTSRHLPSFLCFSIRLWNTLPASAKSQSRSVSSFRSFLHSFYKADKFSLGL